MARAGAAAIAADLEVNAAYYGVVLNAGIARDNAFPAMPGEDWDAVLRTNLDGFYNVMRPLVMPMVRARQGGRIVVLSSVSGVVGNRGQVNYSAAKAGLAGAAKALAVELASRKITVNCVAPGPIATDMIAGAPMEEILKAVPMGRVGRPEDIAGPLLFLAGRGGAYTTGAILPVDGGVGVTAPPAMFGDLE